jgi:hypothetical protein
MRLVWSCLGRFWLGAVFGKGHVDMGSNSINVRNSGEEVVVGNCRVFFGFVVELVN